MSAPSLLDETVRRKLETLSLVARRVRAGAMKGERRSSKHGTSIEFADYRAYSPGDDLRRLDWNVYARMDKPVVKLFEDEEDLAVHVWVDASASMGFPQDGQQDAHKLTYARRLAAALGYIALAENDRVLLSAGSKSFGPARGRGQVVPMLRFLQSVEPAGQTDLNQALSDYAVRAARPGLMFVISDLFSPSGFEDGLSQLLGKGYEVVILQVLSREEVQPALAGDLRLIDSETGAAQEISLDDGLRELYARRLAAWRDELRQRCGRRGVGFASMVTDSPYERVILGDLRRLGWVR
jgi:uncharacterized protein (DUF58 family)